MTSSYLCCNFRMGYTFNSYPSEFDQGYSSNTKTGSVVSSEASLHGRMSFYVHHGKNLN